MSRGLWFAAGAGAGVYAVRKARRVAETFTADGLRDRWNGWSLGARLLHQEVRTGQAEREAELRERFGLTPITTPQLTAPPRHRRLSAGTDETRNTD